jgi:hypothetical protein
VPGPGSTGAVRIIWPGNTRSFPSTGAGVTLGAAIGITTVGASTFIVPDCATKLKVQVIGSGSNGQAGSGGGGGAYASSSCISVTAGNTVYICVGTYNTTNKTWVNKAANSVPTSTANGAAAKGQGNNRNGASAACSLGTVTYSGGLGGLPVCNKAGGGGAGGVSSAGGAGGCGYGPGTNKGSGGGGGAGGSASTAGASASCVAGGAGGAGGTSGTGGTGATSSTNATAGTNGGGGGGGWLVASRYGRLGSSVPLAGEGTPLGPAGGSGGGGGISNFNGGGGGGQVGCAASGLTDPYYGGRGLAILTFSK